MARHVALVFALFTTVAVSGPSAQQALGTFRWQLRPYCNLITLIVRQDGPVYTLTGFDDQCGTGAAASLVGTAFLNPDGSIGFGLTGVTAPGAAPVVLYARLDLGTVGGPWSDSAGNAGTMVLTAGAGASGSPRTVPANGIRPGSVTADQIAAGAIGSGHLAPGSVSAAQLALGSITGAHLAPGSVAGAHIASGAISGAHVAAGSLTGTHIANGSITAAQLAPGSAQPPIAGQCPVGQYLRGFRPSGEVICEPFFSPTVPVTADDPANQVGSWISVAVPADGRPVISHSDSTAPGLRVTKCGNPACSAGNVSTTMDAAVGRAFYTSMVIGPDGLPLISYHEPNTTTLRVLKCGNATCTAGNTMSTADDTPGSGWYSSIAIGSDGLPVIGHYQASAAVVRITHCGNPACSADNVSTTVNVRGWWVDLAIGSDGLPILSYYNGASPPDALGVTRCGNVTCTAGNVSITVDDRDYRVGAPSSIAIGADGLPIIAYNGADTGPFLHLTHCGNVSCTAGNVTTILDGAGQGGYPSIAIGADGLPVVAHQNRTTMAVMVTHCGNVTCTSGNVTTTIDDPTSDVGDYLSLAIGADGLPIVGYRDNTALALRVAKCATQGCR